MMRWILKKQISQPSRDIRPSHNQALVHHLRNGSVKKRDCLQERFPTPLGVSGVSLGAGQLPDSHLSYLCSTFLTDLWSRLLASHSSKSFPPKFLLTTGPSERTAAPPNLPMQISR